MLKVLWFHAWQWGEGEEASLAPFQLPAPFFGGGKENKNNPIKIGREN